jgi:hypothetical protein
VKLQTLEQAHLIENYDPQLHTLCTSSHHHHSIAKINLAKLEFASITIITNLGLLKDNTFDCFLSEVLVFDRSLEFALVGLSKAMEAPTTLLLYV